VKSDVSFQYIIIHQNPIRFQSFNDMVQTAKKLLAMKGVLSSPNAKQGKVLPPATSEMVKLFYVS
jgi:hypothetical protein